MGVRLGLRRGRGVGSGSGRDVPTRRWLGCASRRVCAAARAKRGAAPACLGGKRRPSARMAIVCGAIARAGTWTGRRLQPGRQSTHCWQCVAKVMCGLWRSPLCRLWQLLSPRAYSGGTRGSPPAWCNCLGRGEWGAGREVWGAGCGVLEGRSPRSVSLTRKLASVYPTSWSSSSSRRGPSKRKFGA